MKDMQSKPEVTSYLDCMLSSSKTYDYELGPNLALQFLNTNPLEDVIYNNNSKIFV